MRILGLDYGEKRIGVAVSDPLLLTAQPVGAVESIDELKKLMEKYEDIQEMVVGLPKTMRGEIGIQAEKVLKFVEELKGAFQLPVVTWDERLTTSAAEKDLISAGLSRKKRKKVMDQSAASLILRGYLDSKR